MPAKKVSDPHLNFPEALQHYLLELEISNRAAGTIHNYAETIGELAVYADTEGWLSVRDITKPRLIKYLAYLKIWPRWNGRNGQGERPISESYYEIHFRRIKTFFNWCLAEAYVDSNPLAGISKPKVSERVIPTVPDDEFRRLIRLCDPNLYRHRADIFRAYRNRAALWLLKDSPARREELTALTVDRVDLRERRILVLGKGRRERYMHLGAVTTKAMRKYQMQREAVAPWSDDWWVNTTGEPVGREWLKNMLRRLCERAGVGNINPHRFRHTFAVSVIEADVPLPTLQVMGGWKRVPQTYLATLGDRAAKAAHQKASPADRLARKP